MKSIEKWFAEYGESHRHPRNVAIHKIAVPAIVWSLLGLAWSISVGPTNMAVVLAFAGLGYYVVLSPRHGVGMAGVIAVMLGSWGALAVVLPPGWLWRLAAGVFLIAWAAQFWGHRIEGKKPSFFQDLQFLLIGPLWVLEFWLHRKRAR